MRQLVFCLCSILYLLAGSGLALGQEEAVEEPLEITESGQAYLDKIRYRGVQSEVGYFDPTRPVPPLETRERVRAKPENTEEWSLENVNTASGLIAFAFLIAIAVLFFRFGGASRLALGSGPKAAERAARGEEGDSLFGDGQSRDLRAILKNSERRTALIELVQLLISKSVTANGLLLQRSWTARDVLRRLPKGLEYMPELRELVMIGERVHFRDQPVSEDDFKSFVTRAKPLLKALGS